MSSKPRHHSGVKEQQDGVYDEAVTREASGVEGRTCQDEVRGGGHHEVQDDVGRDSVLLKGDDAKWGRGLEMTNASILEGATSRKEKYQTALATKSRNMVPTADLLAGHSPDNSASRLLQHHIKQVVNDDTVGDEITPDRKVISAKALLQQHVIRDSQDWSVLLPEELVLILFKFMKPGEVLTASQTCQQWRKLGENDKLWEQICKEAGLAFSLTPANLSALERRNKNSTFAYSAWKENFRKPYKIARKFRQEIPQVFTVEVIRNVNEMKIFNDNIVCACDKTLYVFCALSGKHLHSLVGHTENVRVIDIGKQFIVSASRDGSVKVWDVTSGSCVHTLLTRGVSCLQMHGNVVVTGSLDGKLRVWELQEGRCVRTLTGNTGWVHQIQFDGRFVVSGNGLNINVWEPETGVCLRTLVNQNRVRYFKLNGGHVLSVHFDGSIKVWEVETGVCHHMLVENNGVCMELQGDMVVSRSADRTSAKIWSISTGDCLHTLAGTQKHSGFICSIGVNDKFVVTRSMDQKLKLWDIKTGEFIRDFVLESDEMVVKMEMKETKIVCLLRGAANSKLLVLNFDTNEAD